MIRYNVLGLLSVFMLGMMNISALAGQFDGTWKYKLSSDSSSFACQGFQAGEIKIKDSQFSGYINHSQDRLKLRGEVSENGKATGKAIGSLASANFDLNFTKNSASGNWKSREIGCNGTINLTIK